MGITDAVPSRGTGTRCPRPESGAKSAQVYTREKSQPLSWLARGREADFA